MIGLIDFGKPNLVLKYQTFLRYPEISEIARIKRSEFVLHKMYLLKEYYTSIISSHI